MSLRDGLGTTFDVDLRKVLVLHDLAWQVSKAGNAAQIELDTLDRHRRLPTYFQQIVCVVMLNLNDILDQPFDDSIEATADVGIQCTQQEVSLRLLHAK